MADKPSVLFVCVHNAGRSQMAAAWLTHLAGDRIEVRSAGSAPGDRVKPAAVAAMAEVGIDISAETPKILTVDAVRESDVCITMGCGDACPVFPGKRYLDWKLDDPAGQGVEAVRPIRDEIRALVEGLISEIAPTRPETTACDPAAGLRAPAHRSGRCVGMGCLTCLGQGSLPEVAAEQLNGGGAQHVTCADGPPVPLTGGGSPQRFLG